MSGPIATFDALRLFECLAWVAAALALVQAVLLFIQTIEHGRYCDTRLTSVPRLRPSGQAVVVVPCKGLDLGLSHNLRPLLEQDYPNYRLVFVVESLDDPACGPIRSLLDEYPHVPASLVAAGRATSCGQKVHSLLRATDQLGDDVRFLAFADSDVRTSTTWLRRMIERLVTRADTGAVTGYRWLLPQRHSLANLVLYSLNCAIATLFTSGGHHLLWGGCWAIRRELFDGLRIRDAWQGVLSDDLAASRAIHRAGLRIKFEPSCMLATPWDGGTTGMFDFLYRQHFMLWRYLPRWSLAMLAATLVTVGGFWCPLAATLLIHHRTGQWPLAMLALVSLVYGLQVSRGMLRTALAARYFPGHLRALAPAAGFDMVAGPLTAAVSLLVMLAAAFGRRVHWRQVSYMVDGEGTVVSAQHAQPRRRIAGRAAPLRVPAGA